MTRRESTILDLLRTSPMTLHELAYRLGLRKSYVRWRVDMLRERGAVRPVRTLHQHGMMGAGRIVWGIA
jgi:predicted ArsR family transcriptional regulator